MVEEQTYKKISAMLGLTSFILLVIIFALVSTGFSSHQESLGMGYYFAKCEDLYYDANECELTLEEIEEVKNQYKLKNMEDFNFNSNQPGAAEWEFQY